MIGIFNISLPSPCRIALIISWNKLASCFYYQFICTDSSIEPLLCQNARHIIKFLFHLLSVHFRLGFTLLVFLDPRPKANLNDRDPYYVATIIDIPIELINLVNHFLVVLLRHARVLFDHLYLFLDSLDLNIIYFLIEFSLLVFFEINYLILSHLVLDLIYHLHSIFALKVFFAKHGYDILKVVVLEFVICRYLKVRDKNFCIFGISCQRYCNKRIIEGVNFRFHLKQKFFKFINRYKCGSFWIIFLPDLFYFFNLFFELRNAFVFIRGSKAV